MNLADILIETYAVESAMLRTEKLISLRGEEACADYVAMTKIYMQQAVNKINSAAKEAIASFTKGGSEKIQKLDVDTKSLRRQDYYDQRRQIPILFWLIKLKRHSRPEVIGESP